MAIPDVYPFGLLAESPSDLTYGFLLRLIIEACMLLAFLPQADRPERSFYLTISTQ